MSQQSDDAHHQVCNVATSKSNNNGASHEDQDVMANFMRDNPKFRAVLEQVNLEKIVALASSIRYASRIQIEGSATDPPIGCTIFQPPQFGSFNVVFRILFDDKVRWMLKIPANGNTDDFDTLAAKALESEAQTMRFLKRQTSIPVPAVHSYSTATADIGCPYILMDCVDGKPLYAAWFDESASETQLEHIRTRALQTVATAMAQLSQLRLGQGGSLEFDSDGYPVSIGSAKTFDTIDMYDRMNKYGQCRADGDGDDAKSLDNEAEAEKAVFFEKGPLSDPYSAMIYLLERASTRRDDNAYNRGADECIRMFARWVLERMDQQGNQFVLAHPDFDFQNTFVLDDGTLSGMIDWDGVAAVPLSVGSLCYPNWLMRDWEPTYYNMNPENGELLNPKGRQENTPRELMSYRIMYAQFIEMALSSGSNPAHAGQQRQLACITRYSLIAKSLDLAATVPFFRDGIVDKLFKELVEVDDAEQESDDEEDLIDGDEEESVNGNGQRSSATSMTSSPLNSVDTGIPHQDIICENEHHINAMTEGCVKESQKFNCIQDCCQRLVTGKKSSQDAEEVDQHEQRSNDSNEVDIPKVLNTSEDHSTQPHQEGSVKVRAAKVALACGEQGLRRFANLFHTKVHPVETVDKPAVEGPAAAVECNSQKTDDMASSRTLNGNCQRKILKKSTLANFIAELRTVLIWLLGLTANEMAPDLEAQIMKPEQGTPEAKIESPSTVRQGPRLDGCIQGSVEIQDETAFIEKTIRKPQTELKTNDIWERVARQVKDCGVTKAMLKDGQQEAAEWMILYLKERARQKEASIEQAKEEARTAKRKAAGVAKEAKKVEEAIAMNKSKMLCSAVIDKNVGRGCGGNTNKVNICAGRSFSKAAQSKNPNISRRGPQDSNMADIDKTTKLESDQLCRRTTGQPVATSAGELETILEAGGPPAVGNSREPDVMHAKEVREPAATLSAQAGTDHLPVPRCKACPCGSRRKYNKCCGKVTSSLGPEIEPIGSSSEKPTDVSDQLSPVEALLASQEGFSSESLRGTLQQDDSISQPVDEDSQELGSSNTSVDSGADARDSLPQERQVVEGMCSNSDIEADCPSKTKDVKDQRLEHEEDDEFDNEGENAESTEEENLDHGGFTMEEICYALGTGNLGEQRHDRLHQCFNRLLDWTAGEW